MKELRFHRVGGAVIDFLSSRRATISPAARRGRRWCDSAGEDISMHSESWITHFSLWQRMKKQAHARRVAQVFEAAAASNDAVSCGAGCR